MYIHTFKSFNEIEKNVNEGLIKTYPIKSAINFIENALIDYRMKFKINNVDTISNVFDLEIYDYCYNDLLNLKMCAIESSLVNVCGYYPSRVKIEYCSGMEDTKKWNDSMWDDLVNYSKYYKNISIHFESKFDEEVITTNKYMYHITNEIYVKKILKNGLAPKSKNKLSSHPDRIYICKSIEDVKKLISKMRASDTYNNLGLNTKKGDKYSVLQIDIENIDIKIRKDPNYEDGYYITRNIEPDRIEILESGL